MEKCHTLCQRPAETSGPAVWRDIFLKYFSLFFFFLVFLSAQAVLQESVNPDYILAPYWLQFSQFYVLQITWGSPEDLKNRIPRLLLPMNLNLGFKTFCEVDFQELPLLVSFLPIAPFWTLLRSQWGTRDPVLRLTPPSSSSIWKASKKMEKKKNCMPFKYGSCQDLFITLCKNSMVFRSWVFLWIIIANPAALIRHSESANNSSLSIFWRL